MSHVYGKQGEVAVCFHEDGHFYAAFPNDDGTHGVDFDAKLMSVGDEWQYATDDTLPHNDIHRERVVDIEME